MNTFFGFDLGDAESCITKLRVGSEMLPEVIPVAGAGSFVTSYAVTSGGDLIIGEEACLAPDAVRRELRFKSRFLKDKKTDEDIRRFAGGVLALLKTQDTGVSEEESCFYVGCPAGWDLQTRERYRSIFEHASYPPVRIISESRAALVCACQSKHLQVGYDILSKPVLVIDIGSSTTDFAYICEGKEVQMQTAGEVYLGGGLMDEILLSRCVQESPDADEIRRVFAESQPWKSYCEFSARRLKERYYSDSDYWDEHACISSIMIHYDRPLMLRLHMDREMASSLIHDSIPALQGRSFEETFIENLRQVRKAIDGIRPQLIFLTGGVSGHPDIATWCGGVFPDAVVITGTEPAYAVARGLAWCGRIDDNVRQFRKELDQLISSSTVESIVRSHMSSLYEKCVDVLVKPLIEEAAVPVYERWRQGSIRRLKDTDGAMQESITAFLHSDKAHDLLSGPVSAWLRPIAIELERYTMPICIRHDIPYSALSLSSYLSASDIDVRIDAKDVFAVEEVTWMINSLISVMVGLLCGGSGIALISSGPTGILAGTVASLLVLTLGKEKMEEALMKVDFPVPLRKLIPRGAFSSRLESVSSEVREKLIQSFREEKNEDISLRMADDIAHQIEQCLSKMAEIVEIPLG